MGVFCKRKETIMNIYDKVIKATEIVKENVVPKRCNNCGGLILKEWDKDLEEKYPYFCPCCYENKMDFEVEDVSDEFHDEEDITALISTLALSDVFD